MPDQQSVLTVDRHFTREEMTGIRLGLLPREMEDRWFIVYKRPTLFMYRSWTGHCIYAADFARQSSEYRIKELRVNRDPEQYRATDDAEDVALFLKIIELFLLPHSSEDK